MHNLDELKQKKSDIAQRLTAAAQSGNNEDFQAAIQDLMDFSTEAVMAAASGSIEAQDTNILLARGQKQLTSEEKAFYQSLVAVNKSSDPKGALANTDLIWPKTIIDSIFEDIQEEHPILGMIDFQNTGVLVEIMLSTTSGSMVWGDLTTEVAGEISASFEKLEIGQKKGMAYMVIPKDLLDVGPEWIDRYVRTVMANSVGTGLATEVVDGTGKNGPLGMTRALSGATDGVYPRKTAIAITEFEPISYGSICSTLSTARNGKRRAIPKIMMVVNPGDYFSKVFPATTVRNTEGGFTNNVLPYPTDVVMESAVPAGHAIIGLPKQYFLGAGTGKDGKIEYSDHALFLTDKRPYLAKIIANGRAKTEYDFVYLDISGLLPYVKKVSVTNASSFPVADVPAYPDARLAALTIGALTLTPVFNKSVFVYALATSNATNTITALAKDGEAEISILLNGVAHTNGAAATWLAGANTVEITVEIAGETETYSVAVTKS